jgi:hypothetical protein
MVIVASRDEADEVGEFEQGDDSTGWIVRGEAHGFVRVVHEEDWDHACSAGFGEAFGVVGDVKG